MPTELEQTRKNVLAMLDDMRTSVVEATEELPLAYLENILSTTQYLVAKHTPSTTEKLDSTASEFAQVVGSQILSQPHVTHTATLVELTQALINLAIGGEINSEIANRLRLIIKVILADHEKALGLTYTGVHDCS